MKVGIIGLGHGKRVLFKSFKLSNIKIHRSVYKIRIMPILEKPISRLVTK